MSKRLLLISDLHIGSLVAPMPEQVDGLDIKPNKVQKKLNDWFWNMVDYVGAVDAVILNGDLVEGHNRKQHGLGCWTTDIALQAECAADMLSYIDTTNFYGTNGSRYHTNENPSGDGLVLKFLHGEFGPYQIIRIGGKRIHAVHKVSRAKYVGNRGNSIGSEITSAILNEPEWGKFDVLVRSHTHYYSSVETRDYIGIITPCWKALDDYGGMLGTSFVPEIGYVVLEMSGGSVSKDVHKKTLKGTDLYKEHFVK